MNTKVFEYNAHDVQFPIYEKPTRIEPENEIPEAHLTTEQYELHLKVEANDNFAACLREIYTSFVWQGKRYYVRYVFTYELLVESDTAFLAKEIVRTLWHEVEMPNKIYRFIEDVVKCALDSKFL